MNGYNRAGQLELFDKSEYVQWMKENFFEPARRCVTFGNNLKGTLNENDQSHHRVAIRYCNGVRRSATTGMTFHEK
jgi:hypothetical protein